MQAYVGYYAYNIIVLYLFTRTLFKRLSVGENEGNISSAVTHPIHPDKKLYLMFDPTHNIKNAFNNWNNKGVFKYPVGFDDLLSSGGSANFRHIKALFLKEEDKSLKIAHSLTKTSLHPNSIAKTSPRHALGRTSFSFSNNC